MVTLYVSMVPESGRRPESIAVENAGVTILVTEIPTDSFTWAGFPLKGFAYWDFESPSDRR